MRAAPGEELGVSLGRATAFFFLCLSAYPRGTSPW
ncbi:hypothetical protein U0070_022772 [Myodes glareolus]|uniref:Uncharacterized protein n=1 Tax=Myodes glareolus TaxID=447135 RepID=A0AAW0HHL4_MYOGA